MIFATTKATRNQVLFGLLLSTSWVSSVRAQEIPTVSNATGVNFTLVNTYDLSNNSTLLPALSKYLSGMFFSDDGKDLFIVNEDRALHRIPLVRDADTNKVIGFNGTSTQIWNYTGLDLMTKTAGAGGILFSAGDDNLIHRGTYDEESETFTKVQDITLEKEKGFGCFPANSSHYGGSHYEGESCEYIGAYGISFHSTIVDPNDASRPMMLVTGTYGIWMVPMIVDAGGNYTQGDQNSTLLCEVASEFPGDMKTIPSGSMAGNIMTIDWSNDKLIIISIDKDTGFPLNATNPNNETNLLPDLGTATPKLLDFVEFPESASPWGMVFDPLTNDIFISSWEADSALLFHFSGFPPGIDVAHITALIKQQIVEALKALNLNGGRRLRKNKKASKKSAKSASKSSKSAKIEPTFCGTATNCDCDLCFNTEDGESCNMVLVKKGRNDYCINSTMWEEEDKYEGYGESCDLAACEFVSETDSDLEVEIKIPTSEEIANEILAGKPEAVAEVITNILGNPVAQKAIKSGDSSPEAQAAFKKNIDTVSVALDMVVDQAEESAAKVLAKKKIKKAKELLDILVKGIFETKVE